MFTEGDKVRLSTLGRARVLIFWRGKPKRIAFYCGTFIVREGSVNMAALHYPVGLDVEDAILIPEDRTFLLGNESLELADV